MANTNILIKNWTRLYTNSISQATNFDASEHKAGNCKVQKKALHWYFLGRG